MKVKVGDKVRILAGKDKGKEGKVTITLKEKNRVVVEGINIVKKHQKPGRQNETGGILETENPIHVSNVKVIESSKKDTKKELKKVESKEKTEVKETKTEKVAKTEKKIAPKAVAANKVAPKTTKSAIRTKKGGN